MTQDTETTRSNEEIVADSPLNDVDENSLDELRKRDPEELTPQEREKAIELLVPKLRAERAKWQAEDDAAHKKGKYGGGPRRELPEGVTSIYDISLE